MSESSRQQKIRSTVYKRFLSTMKKGIHPDYNAQATVKCLSCENSFETGSTKDTLTVELCNMCHPFYTGTQRIIDSAQRVEKFQARAAQQTDTPVRSKREKEAARRAKRADKQKESQKIS